MVDTGLFPALSGDDPQVTELESLCLQCRENGTTRLLLTKIPFYKEIVVMSFRCEHCGWQNSELQPAATIQPTGIRFELLVRTKQDLNRQVVKTKDAAVVVPEVELEIPARTQEGSVTTVEGVLQRVALGLETSMADCSEGEGRVKLSDFVSRLKKLQELKTPFRLILDDPSGNSFVENPQAPGADPSMTVRRYQRTADQDSSLGIVASSESSEQDLHDDVLGFATSCSECQAPCETRMKLTQVPHFKEVLIMATTCDRCGHRTNEVKSGAGIEPQGVRLELRVLEPADLARDVLKSETCTVHVPELELEAGAGLLSGRFTTVEGLLDSMRRQLAQENPFFQGDSATGTGRLRMGAVVDQLAKAAAGTLPVTLVLDDPCGNSYVQSLCAPDPDPALRVTHYERTFEQNDELGLNDMKTEDYS
ncbi:zinc finger protein ZPR1 [Dermacentor albipictus]|uniref:zinc finger protein ZPR1 n=1 Tax=Dermacentor albipictus TaxID=60249 RepID=UPI0038FC4196